MKSSRPKALRSGIGERHDHREPGEDRPGDEVGREDRRVPAGHDADGEVEGHDRVHRDDQRRRQPGEQQVGRSIPVPVPGRAPPAHRQHAVDDPGRAVLRPVAQASPGRGSGRRTRTAARPCRRSRPRRRPRPAGCATAARGPSCWDRAAASRRPRDGPGGAAGTARRRPRRTGSSPRRTG